MVFLTFIPPARFLIDNFVTDKHTPQPDCDTHWKNKGMTHGKIKHKHPVK